MPYARDSISILVLLGVVLTYWGNMPGVGPTIQPLFLVFFVLAALIAVVRARVAPVRITVAEIIFYAMALLSAAVALCRTLDSCLMYSAAFMLTLIMISVIARTLTLSELLDLGAGSAFIMVLITLIVERNQILKALSISIGRNGLYRFRPFGNHPNLTGWMFGASAILLARRMFIADRLIERIIMGMTMAGAVVIVIAASARASVLAMSCAALVAVLREWRPTVRGLLKTLGAAVAALGVMMTVFGSRFLDYLLKILEFKSKTRGVGSGMSGRTDFWAQSWHTFISDPLLILFGGSLRSSDVSIIGFDATEDAYFTILLDSGLFAGAALIALLVCTPFRVPALSRSAPKSRRQLTLLTSFFTFLLVESVFNRYLVAIGNPESILVIMLTIGIAVRRAEQQAHTPVPDLVRSYQRAHEPKRGTATV